MLVLSWGPDRLNSGMGSHPVIMKRRDVDLVIRGNKRSKATASVTKLTGLLLRYGMFLQRFIVILF